LVLTCQPAVEPLVQPGLPVSTPEVVTVAPVALFRTSNSARSACPALLSASFADSVGRTPEVRAPAPHDV
jgi:hypothetical protein